MKSREYNLAPEEKMAREQMMELILISSRFTSSITVENEEKHFNLLFILICDGPAKFFAIRIFY